MTVKESRLKSKDCPHLSIIPMGNLMDNQTQRSTGVKSVATWPVSKDELRCQPARVERVSHPHLPCSTARTDTDWRGSQAKSKGRHVNPRPARSQDASCVPFPPS